MSVVRRLNLTRTGLQTSVSGAASGVQLDVVGAVVTQSIPGAGAIDQGVNSPYATDPYIGADGRVYIDVRNGVDGAWATYLITDQGLIDAGTAGSTVALNNFAYNTAAGMVSGARTSRHRLTLSRSTARTLPMARLTSRSGSVPNGSRSIWTAVPVPQAAVRSPASRSQHGSQARCTPTKSSRTTTICTNAW